MKLLLITKKLFYYLKRLKKLGFAGTIKRINNRTQKKVYKFLWKQKALARKTSLNWKQIPEINKLKNKKFIQTDFALVFSRQLHQGYEGQEASMNKKASPVKSAYKPIFKNKLVFYQDIKIDYPQNPGFNKLFPDIKDPWEQSRFQHLFSLGKKYKKTKNIKNAKTFYKQINNWIAKNPFLLGVNWVCPMEVAIRAINLIYAFYFFKDSKAISTDFWQKFVCSLYDHAKYLENNWETSDKPNNHYLSDLIGYFYLCFFFDDIKHFKIAKEKTIKKILQQFEKQIQPDGTSYEGSTNYHKLVTEIFLHFYLLCKTNNIYLPKNFYKKFEKMFLFLDDCTDCYGNLVQIGDNDSGRILGIAESLFVVRKSRSDCLEPHKQVTHYPNFGLTIIKNDTWHITFRHQTYNKKQPAGHFHQDALSITLSINGIPILVDPGSYVYTANASWRNLFRSAKSHNTFYIKEDDLSNIDLFQLPIKEQKDMVKIAQDNNKVEIENFCIKNSFTAHRKLTLFKDKNLLEIKDWWEPVPLQSNWNLIFHPKIEVKKDENIWKIKHNYSEIANLKTTLKFEKIDGLYSEKYGKKEKCTKLKTHKNLKELQHLQVTLFSIL